ncbi:MAG TPA: NTP transferase domain-containing protein [Candidatus Saccharicenans sp.]|jgi:choline kinase|nr:NTP transferase domain-containing protein [Candidatus Saccharicenans sp.]HRD01568.1 NTP transferase domain-containing protein [Candidatus Saccharicenans sp.]
MTSDLKGLIIAAGRGERISNLCPLKPLLEVNGRTLIDRSIGSLIKAGIKDIVVVTGFRGEQLERHLEEQNYPAGVSVGRVRNEDWEKENGLSVYRAKDLAGDRFILLMSDHIFDPEIITGLRQQTIEEDGLILAVDYRLADHPYVDLDDVTRVKVEENRIVNIGKGLAAYNAFDTGIFYATKGLFEALKESQKKANNFTLSGGVRVLAARERARVMDIGNRFWIDVDDEKAFRQAEDYLKSHGDPF